MAVVSSILEILFVLCMSIYWLIQGPARHRFVLSLLPVGERRGAAEVLAKIGNAMGGYVRGAAINGLIIGALTYVGLLFLGLEYTLVLALFAGVMEVIPIAGPIIASIPIIGLAPGVAQQGPDGRRLFRPLQQFEGNLLLPTVMHSQTRLSPSWRSSRVHRWGAGRPPRGGGGHPRRRRCASSWSRWWRRSFAAGRAPREAA